MLKKALCLLLLLSQTAQAQFALNPNYNTCTPYCDAYNSFSKDKGKQDGQQAGAQLDAMTGGALGGPDGVTLSGASSRPSPGVSSGVDAACFDKLISFGQIGPNCEAVRLADMASDMQARAITLYTTAVAVCGAACAYYGLHTTSFHFAIGLETGATAAMAGACAAGSVAPSCTAACAAIAAAKTASAPVIAKVETSNVTATATGIQGTVDVASNCIAISAAAASWLAVEPVAAGCPAVMGGIGPVIGAWQGAAAQCAGYKYWKLACSGAVAIAGVNDLVSYNKLKQAGADSTSQLMTGLSGGASSVLGGVSFYQAWGTASPEWLSTCGLTGISAAILAIRYQNFTQTRKTAASSCSSAKDSIKSNYDKLKGLSCTPPEPPAPPPPTELALGTSAGTRGSSTGRQGVHGGGDSGLTDSNGMADFGSPALGAATAGDEDVTKHLNPDGLKDGARELGLDPNLIAKQITAGTSPSAILSGMQGGPAGFGAALGAGVSNLEKLAASGQLFQEGAVVGTNYSGGGAGGMRGGAKAPAFMPIGKNATVTKSGEVAFGKPEDKSHDPNDIWHAGYKGSIFGIISKKLDTQRSKITALGYTTSYNSVMTTADIQSVKNPKPAASQQPQPGAK